MKDIASGRGNQMTDSLYAQLCARYPGASTDRHGNVFIDCVNCGRPARDKKCSFSPKGFFCFICSEGGGLQKLARLLDLPASHLSACGHAQADACPHADRQADSDYRPPPTLPQKPPPQWTRNPQAWLERFLAHPRRIELWQKYRPFTLETIAAHQFGAGILPATRCRHERITYPVYSDGKIVSLRGRVISCDCPKWINSAWSKAALWGRGLLRSGLEMVLICESPPDSVLAMQELEGVISVASSNGAGKFDDEWAKAIADSKPELVVVALDNNLPGQVMGDQRTAAAKEWRADHPRARRLPVANGPRIATMLANHGTPVHLLDWREFDAPLGADIGWLVSREIMDNGQTGFP